MHTTFSYMKSGVYLVSLRRMHEIANDNAERATMAIVIRCGIILVVRLILQLQQNPTHDDAQMSLQQCVGFLWCLEFLPRMLTHIPFSIRIQTQHSRRGWEVYTYFALLWMHISCIDRNSHNECQMSIQENVGTLWSLKSLPLDDSPQAVLDSNTNSILVEGERYTPFFPPMNGRCSPRQRRAGEMAIAYGFRIILVVRSIIHFQGISTHNAGQMSLQ